MNTKSFVFLFTGLIGVTTINSSASVQAQAQVKLQQSIIPKFISSSQAGQLKLQDNGKPFIPPSLGRSTTPNEGDSRGIVGRDNRIPMLSRKYPWSTIGRVQGTTADARGYHCTGTLIDDNLVLTNAHCVIDSKTGKHSTKIQFIPNVIDKNYQDIADVEEVHPGTDFKQNSHINPNDWAIMKINQPLGRKYGHLGLISIPTAKLVSNPKAFFFVGYSSDFPNKTYQKDFSAGPGWTASYEAGCSILKEDAGFLLHDCATAKGSSGGGIIGVINGEPYIVALNNAERKTSSTGQDNINLAVKISSIATGFGWKLDRR